MLLGWVDWVDSPHSICVHEYFNAWRKNSSLLCYWTLLFLRFRLLSAFIVFFFPSALPLKHGHKGRHFLNLSLLASIYHPLLIQSHLCPVSLLRKNSIFRSLRSFPTAPHSSWFTLGSYPSPCISTTSFQYQLTFVLWRCRQDAAPKHW